MKKTWSPYLSEKHSWLLFKIMGEFVDGFETLEKIGPCISIFGSARLQPSNQYYQLALTTASALAKEGFGILTGAGLGIMEAANKGATEASGTSAGVQIYLPFESDANQYIEKDKLFKNKYFFIRKVLFVKYAQAFIVFPGGLGTLDELFECLTLIQTQKMKKIPIILMGVDFWTPLISWLKLTVLQEGCMSASDFESFILTDNPSEALAYIKTFYESHNLKPNF